MFLDGFYLFKVKLKIFWYIKTNSYKIQAFISDVQFCYMCCGSVIEAYISLNSGFIPYKQTM